MDFCEVTNLGELSATQFCLFMEILSNGFIDFCEVTNLGELSATQFCLFMEIFEHWCNRLLRIDKFGRTECEATLFIYGNL
jgi:hypothetical protein